MFLEKNKRKYKKYIKIANNMLSKKEMNIYELNFLESQIDLAYFSNGCEADYKILNLYGKVYLARGDLDNAKRYFNAALEFSENDFPKASYHGLFKTAVSEGNYADAMKQLALYDSCYSNKFNMIFYFKCLNKISELKQEKVYQLDYFINENGYINCVKAPKEVLALYEKAEKLFDDREYLMAHKVIQKAQELCINKNYPLDFMPLLNIISKVNTLYIEKGGIDFDNQKIVECLSIMDNNEDKKKYLKKLSNDPKNVFAILKLIEILISEENYSEAYSYLNRKMDVRETQKHIKELNELRKRVYEAYDYEKNKDMIETYLTKAKEAIDIRDNNSAFNIYKEGYNKLQTPIFLFKIGELNYFLGNISLAKKYFVKYKEKGKKYEIESCIYLGYIELIKDKKSIEEKNFNNFYDEEDIDKYSKIEEKAEDIYFKMVEKEKPSIFSKMGKDFENYLSEILSSIKKGKVYRIEKIDQNRHDPLEMVLIQIAAAPLLLEMGQTYLADKYYERSLIFSDDKIVSELSNQYRLLRDSKKDNK